MQAPIAFDTLVTLLHAAGDSTRLRLVLLLRKAELTVSELVEILGQSQPRVSQHLKALCDSGLLERFKEGSWVFYRAVDRGPAAAFAAAVDALAADGAGLHASDLERLARVRTARAAEAAAFFKANAVKWADIRALHAPEQDVEAAIVRRLADRPIDSFLDVGTGTGRMIELFAPYARRAVGLDVSPDMLAIARDRLMRPGFAHCQVRLGDVYRLTDAQALTAQDFDVVLFYQVLHYLEDPRSAVLAATRVLRPGGRLLIADFAPHDLEFLRSDYAHRRLGFFDDEVQGWFVAGGLALEASEIIGPRPASTGQLTVRIWLGASP